MSGGGQQRRLDRDGLQIGVYPTPNRLEGRAGRMPRAIVCHTTDGSFAGVVAWFASPESRVSAHYLVGLDGTVASFVEEQDTARHAGRVSEPTASIALAHSDLNPLTIGIEFEDGGSPETVERPPAQYDSGARLIAGIARRWGIPLDRTHVIGHREVFAAKACPGNLDIDELLERARALPAPGETRRSGLTVLLTARNAEADLDDYLGGVGHLQAQVVALDDGSTDRTAEILECSPHVVALLHNPRREGHLGWDDAANRRRLLDEAIGLESPWVLSLDADERIDPDDAAALRAFLANDALPGLGYGFPMYRDWEGRVVPWPTFVYRLFSPRPGDRFPSERLHFVPMPTRLPRSRWVRTTIRLRHLDSPERLDARKRKYAEADPTGEFALRTAPMLPPAPRHTTAWSPRTAQPVVAPDGETRPSDGAEPAKRPLLVALLPARNAEQDLPGWLSAVEGLADGVIALDDGSTDRTGELLERSPLVVRVLRSPPRPDYADWDDAANRQALLDLAAELSPRWVLFLDADERIDADEAQALREFLELEADPRDAYGFLVHRMIGDESQYDRAGLWVYRLFAWQPGLRLPTQRLHLVPVPVSIPSARRRRTTIRIKHLASLSPERRSARLDKYREADPGNEFQADYAGAFLEVGQPKRWQPRPPGLKVLAEGDPSRERAESLEIRPDDPVLSAIVISRNDEDRIERAVRSVVGQRMTVPFEVIVVVSGDDRTADIVRKRFPTVELIELDGVALPGRARNAGVRVARGEYLSFPGSHVELPPGSLQARFEAHERGWAMVTGSIVNGTPTPAGWASYFLDHCGSLPGRPSGELAAAPAHCSYVRQFVVDAGGFPEDLRAGEDTVLNEALWRRGHRAWREQGLRLTHSSRCETRRRLILHHFTRGRALGRILREGRFGSGAGRADPEIGAARLPIAFLRGYANRRVQQTEGQVTRWGGDLAERYFEVKRLARLGISVSAVGTALELARPRRRRRGRIRSISGGS